MDLDVPMRLNGRAAQPVEYVRDLTEADLALLGSERGVQAVPLKRLRERHHALARALASGLKDGDAAAVCGYDPSRVSILKADPTFQELLSFYSEMTDVQYAGMHERLAGLGLEAVEELRERLEVSPDDFSVRELNSIVETAADRTGHGPASSSTQTNIHVNIATRLEAGRKRVAAARMIDITPEQE